MYIYYCVKLSSSCSIKLYSLELQNFLKFVIRLTNSFLFILYFINKMRRVYWNLYNITGSIEIRWNKPEMDIRATNFWYNSPSYSAIFSQICCENLEQMATLGNFLTIKISYKSDT